MRHLSATALGLALLMGSARGAEAPRLVNLWPFFRMQTEAGETEIEALGPLVFHRRTAQATTYGLRPFFSVHREPERDRRVLHVLYPLSYSRREGTARRTFVFPFLFLSSRIASNGQPMVQNVVFPFVWWGHHPEHGKWWFLLFLTGKVYGLLGADEMAYRAGYIYERRGDYEIRYYAWPLVTIGKGGGKRSVRIWPFWGRTEQAGQWWNRFILWPFYTDGHREAGSGKPAADYWSLWPFYGRARNLDGSGASTMALWPFFQHVWTTRNHLSAWRILYPFYSSTRSDDVQAWRLWPFYGQRRTQVSVERQFLGRLIETARVRARGEDRDELTVFRIFRRAVSHDKKSGERRAFTLLWPLWRSRSRTAADGKRAADAQSLQVAWFANSAAFERNVSALFGLYEHAEAPDGSRATRVLWRGVRSERGPGYRLLELGPLASWWRSGGLTRASFALGLLQTGTNDGKRGWRVLYIPFGASLRRPASKD